MKFTSDRKADKAPNMNADLDPLARVHDDDLRLIISKLDKAHIGLTDMQASPELDNAPELQGELGGYARVVRVAADLLFHLREESHQ